MKEKYTEKKSDHRPNCDCACVLCTDEGLRSYLLGCVLCVVQVGYGLGETLFLCLAVLVLSAQ